MVLPGVAQFTRVCAYDRPGTIGDVNPALEPNGPLCYPSRSDPVPQPRTTQDRVDDLHALKSAGDGFDFDAIMVSAGMADMISIGSGWEQAADEEGEEHSRK